MEKHFFDPGHKERFFRMVAEDGMSPHDSERTSLFYLIAGNDDLYRKRKFIYDPEGHCICACLDNPGVDFSSGARALIRLGFNLYNGYKDNYTAPLDLFWNLDSGNRLLAYHAIWLRFNGL